MRDSLWKIPAELKKNTTNGGAPWVKHFPFDERNAKELSDNQKVFVAAHVQPIFTAIMQIASGQSAEEEVKTLAWKTNAEKDPNVFDLWSDQDRLSKELAP